MQDDPEPLRHETANRVERCCLSESILRVSETKVNNPHLKEMKSDWLANVMIRFESALGTGNKCLRMLHVLCPSLVLKLLKMR